MPDVPDPLRRLRESYRAAVAEHRDEITQKCQRCISVIRAREIARGRSVQSREEADHVKECTWCGQLLENAAEVHREALAGDIRHVPFRAKKDTAVSLAVVACAVAASLVIGGAIGVWLGGFDGQPQSSIVELVSSPNADPTVNVMSAEFRSGQTVFLHSTLRSRVWTFVAVVGEDLTLSPAVTDVEVAGPGGQTYEFELDENPGRESFFLLASPVARTSEEFAATVASVARAIESLPKERQARLQATEHAFRARGLQVRVATIHHLPR